MTRPLLPARAPRRGIVPTKLPTIALALGGGGARGLAHIAILDVLDQMGVRPTIIAGTSIGAIYGAAYAAGIPADSIRAHTEEILSNRFDLLRQVFGARSDPVSKLLNLLPFRTSLLKPEALLDALLPQLIPRTFAELHIPLLTLATDYYTQEQVVFREGPLRPAIAASIALPALFTPPKIDGRVLMDGGLVNPLPFDCLIGRADITIAIDVSGAGLATLDDTEPSVPSAFEALIASSQILQSSIVREKLRWQQPDILIRMPVDRFHVLDFMKFRDIIAAAEGAKIELRTKLTRLLGAETVLALAPPKAALASIGSDAIEARSPTKRRTPVPARLKKPMK